MIERYTLGELKEKSCLRLGIGEWEPMVRYEDHETIIAKLRAYLFHQPDCALNDMGRQLSGEGCTCGLDEVWKELSDEKHED